MFVCVRLDLLLRGSWRRESRVGRADLALTFAPALILAGEWEQHRSDQLRAVKFDEVWSEGRSLNKQLPHPDIT